jgi:tRNA pseudouridine65 synthase
VLKKIEFPQAVGTRHATSRYSWLEVEPRTGRFHQIRRHMNRISHPVIGDASHGDSRHNRFFRETLGISGLCLRAISLQVFDAEDKPLLFKAGPSRQWEKIQGLWSRL